MEHHLRLLTDRKEQVALMVTIGEVWWKEMSRVDRAEAIFNQAIQLDPESRQAVAALGRLYERSGNWNLALDMLQREARIAGASRDAVDIYVRLGSIQEDMLLDLAAAKEAYGKALALDPGCLPALRAMKGIAEREGNRDAYLEMLTAEARYAEDDEQRADRWTEVGRIHQEERDDREGAVRAYEEALKRKADHLPAARPLSDLYVAMQRWPDAARVLEAIVRTLEGGGDAKELCRQSYRQGYVAEKLGQRDQALRSYRRAYELDATYLPALEGLGNLLVAEGQLEEALRIFTAIIIHHRDQLTDLEVVETHWQIGEVADKLQQPDRAIGSFKKALELDGGHEPSRRSLIRLLEAAGDWEGAVEQRQRLLATLDGPAALRGPGGHRRRPAATTSRIPTRPSTPTWAPPSSIPTDLPVTEALLALYRETRQGQKAADVLEQIIARPEVQADGPRAAKLHVLLAEILRDEVKDEAGALAQFEKALDLNPRLPQAFAWIEQVLARGKRWTELEQAYLRMVQRLPKTAEAAPARLALWKTLGDLYRNVLKSDDGARMAYQVVSRADPEDAVAVELYADLSARTPGQEAEAVQAYRQLLKLGAKPQKALSALVSLHATRKQFDRAYSAAQVLVHLAGQATPEDVAVVARLRKFARDQASPPARRRALGAPAPRAAARAAGRHHDAAGPARPPHVRADPQGAGAQPQEGRARRADLDALPRQHVQVRGPHAGGGAAAALPARGGAEPAAAGADRPAGRAGGRGALLGSAQEGALVRARQGAVLPAARALHGAAHAARPARPGLPGGRRKSAAAMSINLRNIFTRMQPTQQDIRTLHGVIMAIAQGRKGPARGGVLEPDEAQRLRSLIAEGQEAGEGSPVRGLARLLRRNPTEAERVLWQALVNDKRFAGRGFSRQVPIGPHITDFVSFPLKCVIDLVPASESVEAAATRAARRAYSAERGYRVVAVSTEEAERNVAGVLERLATILAAASR